MAARTDAAIASGLKLKKLTASHLRRLSETREYLMARYDPELSAASEITRMKATLDEVATKVAAVVRSARTCSIPGPQVNQAPPNAKAT